MQQINFNDGVMKILEKDSRYAREAYEFLREALEFTQKALNRSSKTKLREMRSAAQLLAQPEQLGKSEENHISGQELLNGIREYALAMFGPMTLSVFDQWGLRNCADFGNMVFLMVENGLLRKTEKDSPEDFRSGYDFEQAFREPFLPENKKKGTVAGERQATEVEKT
jgi:uncharacterized repeat protein (TIGR04138 family)